MLDAVADGLVDCLVPPPSPTLMWRRQGKSTPAFSLRPWVTRGRRVSHDVSMGRQHFYALACPIGPVIDHSISAETGQFQHHKY
jgi:hypothetical protein